MPSAQLSISKGSKEARGYVECRVLRRHKESGVCQIKKSTFHLSFDGSSIKIAMSPMSRSISTRYSGRLEGECYCNSTIMPSFSISEREAETGIIEMASE